MGTFFVSDLNARGELQSTAPYAYEQLELIPGASDLIAELSASLWRSSEEFETPISKSGGRLSLRWLATAPTAGILTIRFQEQLSSISLLASGKNADADRLTFSAFQQHQLRELHDTGIEPAFDLLEIDNRPLVATITFQDPKNLSDQAIVALLDRCFAASYFRYLRLV